VNRLTGGDVLMRRLGVNPPIQLLWRVEQPLDADLLGKVNENLASGPLNRRLRDSRLPLARPVWVPHDAARPVQIAAGALDRDDVMDWADAACRVGLDAHAGHGWQLSATEVADGTSIVSLVSSHALADGQGAIGAVTLAARGAYVRAPKPTPPSLLADFVDAVSGGAHAYGRLEIARRRAPFEGRSLFGGLRASLGKPVPPGAGGPPSVRGRVGVTVSAQAFEEAARAAGGSPTGLALAVTANGLRAARGRAGGNEPFVVALPVSFRRPNDLESSNMVGIASLRLDPQEGRYTDLSEIRKRSKVAYGGVGYGQHLTGYPTSDAALSNVGEIPAEAKDAFGTASAVLLRTVSGGGGPPGRMNSFVIKSGQALTLAFQSAGVAVAREHVGDELTAWGLAAQHWW
jgi:hypothetical protein